MSKDTLINFQQVQRGVYYWKPKHRNLACATLLELRLGELGQFRNDLTRCIRSFFLLRVARELLVQNQVKIGGYAELVAEGYLVSRGFTPLHRNWRTMSGELDLIMTDGAELVFVEVKSRLFKSSSTYQDKVSLFDNLTPKKCAKIRSLAYIYLGLNLRKRWSQVRIDLVGVKLVEKSNQIYIEEIQHIVSAF